MKKLKYNPLLIIAFHFVFVININAINDTTNIYKYQQNQAKLFDAISKGEIEIVKTLINNGLNPNICDNKGWTPLDYSYKKNRPEIASYLKSVGGLTYIKQMRNMYEGPFVKKIDNSKVEIFYLVHDSLKYNSSISSKEYLLSEFPITINNITFEKNDFKAPQFHPIGKYEGVKKIFAIGDVHGQYDRVFELLKGNQIIDEKGNWIWGKGHLVFVGDIFDRGSKVTEMLWLIFKLEKQAKMSGGNVHLLLGNHEPMVFKNDIRYIADNYYSLCENLGLSYSKLFDENTVLGTWLRQKPVILKINDYIFVHAGISPKLFEMKMGLDSINSLVWNFLNNKENKNSEETRTFILSSKGILWYRGYTQGENRKEVIDEITLESQLKFYKAKSFVVGHTEVDSVSTFFKGKVINLNIPKANPNIKEQALLIEGDKLFTAYSNGEKKEL